MDPHRGGWPNDRPPKAAGRDDVQALPGRRFTRDEAERMLPLVRAIVRDLVGCHKVLTERVEAYVRHVEARRRGAALPEGFDPESEEVEIESLEDAFNGALEELFRLGLVCRDPQRGVVEFPVAPGRLLWTFGEDRFSAN
jgi:hypothetical protein